MYFVWGITYTAPGALAFQNIKWRMYMIWFALTVISSIVVYFFIPETKQIPVEEIGGLFGDPVIVHLTADGHAIVEDIDVDKALEVLQTGSGFDTEVKAAAAASPVEKTPV